MAEPTGARAQELSFRIGLAVKGFDGVVELIAGLGLWFAPELVRSILNALANADFRDAELRQFVSHWAGRLGESFATESHVVAIVFLVSHGAVKLVLVYCLLRDYRWVYRPAIAILGLFALYQLVIVVQHPTPAKLLFLALDLVIIWLVWREWKARSSVSQKPD